MQINYDINNNFNGMYSRLATKRKRRLRRMYPCVLKNPLAPLPKTDDTITVKYNRTNLLSSFFEGILNLFCK